MRLTEIERKRLQDEEIRQSLQGSFVPRFDELVFRAKVDFRAFNLFDVFIVPGLASLERLPPKYPWRKILWTKRGFRRRRHNEDKRPTHLEPQLIWDQMNGIIYASPRAAARLRSYEQHEPLFPGTSQRPPWGDSRDVSLESIQRAISELPKQTFPLRVQFEVQR